MLDETSWRRLFGEEGDGRGESAPLSARHGADRTAAIWHHGLGASADSRRRLVSRAGLVRPWRDRDPVGPHDRSKMANRGRSPRRTLRLVRHELDAPETNTRMDGRRSETRGDLGRDGSLNYHRDLIATVRRTIAEQPDVHVAVLPESALGFWTPTVARLWREGLRGSDRIVIAGAAVVDPKGYDNVMVAISADKSNILYRERMPVPGSMWQPWLPWTGQGGGARADFFGNPVVEVDGARVAPLICYEQLILWPILQSMLHSPEVIVAVGNGWWTENTSIVAIQKASVSAWARLFDLPVVMTFNT